MTSHVPMSGSFLGPYTDFLAAALVLIFSVVLLLGVQISSKVNIAIALLNVFAILFIVSKWIYSSNTVEHRFNHLFWSVRSLSLQCIFTSV